VKDFTLNLSTWLWLILTILTILGCAYALFAAFLLRRFAQESANLAESRQSVTFLKPLYGAEPELEANLASFCSQECGGPVQLIFGLQDAADPAAAVVHRLIERFPQRDIELVIDPALHGANRKISNLINMLPRARYGVLVISDSDMKVQPDYLRAVIAALGVPGVGLVTCLYRGRATTGLWSRLAAAGINDHFLPAVLVGLKLGLAHPCFGSTIALRSETLRQIGGFEAFSDRLADDYAIGAAVRASGLQVAIPPLLVDHRCSEQSFTCLFRHELRWARTLRVLNPVGYAGSIVTHPLPFALAAAAIQGFGALGLGVLALALACRLSVPLQVRNLRGGGGTSAWLSPLRDLLSFAVFLASFLPGPLSWRGHRYTARPDGTLTQT
jgi:ceramide glucosyltransferase